MLPPSKIPLTHRMRYSGYGLAVGLFIGLFLGWSFHGLLGVVFRLMIAMIVLVPLALALIFWLRVNQENQRARSDVQEAEWRDLTDAR